jgi:cation transporter-like permease
MNRLQKYAWYQLVVLTLWMVIMAVVAAVIYSKNLNPQWLTLPLLFGVFIRFDRLFFPLKPGKIEYDERDSMIKQRALNFAYTIFWYVFVFGSLITYFILGPMNSMPTGVFVIIILSGAVLLRFAWSIAVITLYGINPKQKSNPDLIKV